MLQDSLLKTKLHIPPGRSELVLRPRLIEQYWHIRTGEDACGVAVPRFASPLRGASRGPLPCARPQDWPGLCPERRDRNADAHRKRAAQTGCTLQVMVRDAERWSR
jgi:hypothetical protein